MPGLHELPGQRDVLRDADFFRAPLHVEAAAEATLVEPAPERVPQQLAALREGDRRQLAEQRADLRIEAARRSGPHPQHRGFDLRRRLERGRRHIEQ